MYMKILKKVQRRGIHLFSNLRLPHQFFSWQTPEFQPYESQYWMLEPVQVLWEHSDEEQGPFPYF